MKKSVIAVLVIGCLVATGAISAGNSWNKRGQGGGQGGSLDAVETSMLVFMREEEKLARDVYRVLYATWGKLVFANISESEQSHMDALANMLAKYRVPDPIVEDSTGVFQDEELLALYESLVSDGEASVVAALKVGALIEEIDMLDIAHAIEETDEADLQEVYENLLRGSRNHLRAFNRTLENLGVVYTPQELDLATFEAIVTSAFERGE